MPHSEKSPQVGPPTENVGGAFVRWRLGRQLAGWGLMVLGVAGLLLPVLPGWFFLAWGAITLAPDVPFFARLLDRLAHRLPPLRAAIERVRGMPED